MSESVCLPVQGYSPPKVHKILSQIPTTNKFLFSSDVWLSFLNFSNIAYPEYNQHILKKQVSLNFVFNQDRMYTI